MSTITITLSDEGLAKLKDLADEVGVPPEKLLQTSVEEWLTVQKPDFMEAAAYVLKKNVELYRRLA